MLKKPLPIIPVFQSMCLIFVALQSHPHYPVIIAANRDEFHQRPTAQAQFWEDDPHILGGRDLQAGGTWLGINRSGAFAAITNFREINNNIYPHSRGRITTDFLRQSPSTTDFYTGLRQSAEDYAAYNCLFGQLTPNSELVHFSNREKKPLQTLETGIYGLSNGLLDSTWFKIEEGKKEIKSLLSQGFNHQHWFDFLSDQTQAEDHALPSTGVTLEQERFLSSRFMQSDDYGTRCSTLITVDQQGRIGFSERSYNKQGHATSTQHFTISTIHNN